VICLFLSGGWSQYEAFDPKPAAAAEVRGPFQAIPSCLPGLSVGEYLPQLARRMDRLALVRSVQSADANHNTSLILTGRECGSDGELQAELDRLGVPYTGSGATASRVAFHKSQAKLAFVSQGVSTPPWMPLESSLSPGQCAAQARRLGFPLVVKPDAQGSSLGVSLVRDETGLESALDLAFGYGSRLILEQAIFGQEWTVGLLDLQPLPPLLIQPQPVIFDFEAKYHSPDIQCRLCEADHPDQERVVEAARNAVAAVGACGVSRVDLIVDAWGRPWVLEVNTIPGFTDHSLVPFAARAVGMSFADLCHWCVEAALSQPGRRRAA